MRGLQDSRWASSRSSSVPATRHSQWTSTATRTISTTASSSSSTALSSVFANPLQNGSASGLPAASIPLQPSTATGELRRFMKLARRMRWKLPFLADGYRQATTSSSSLEHAFAVDPVEAELMFKLDFFEFYMLCERALVHLQAVFGITISRGGQHYGGANGGRNGFVSEHRYHANVLEALDREDNPLHGALGSGDVRQQLARAKDLRNRWKNADDGPDRADTASPPPLDSYDLDRIVTTIFTGFDAAFIVAETHVAGICEQHARAQAQVSGDAHGPSNPLADMMMFEQEDYDFITGAMDWEAV